MGPLARIAGHCPIGRHSTGSREVSDLEPPPRIRLSWIRLYTQLLMPACSCTSPFRINCTNVYKSTRGRRGADSGVVYGGERGGSREEGWREWWCSSNICWRSRFYPMPGLGRGVPCRGGPGGNTCGPGLNSLVARSYDVSNWRASVPANFHWCMYPCSLPPPLPSPNRLHAPARALLVTSERSYPHFPFPAGPKPCQTIYITINIYIVKIEYIYKLYPKKEEIYINYIDIMHL